MEVQFLGDRIEEDINRKTKLNKGLVHEGDRILPDLGSIKNIYPIGYWSEEDVKKYAKMNNKEFGG